DQFHAGDGETPEDLVRGEEEGRWLFRTSFPDSTTRVPADAEWTVLEEAAERVVFGLKVGGLSLTKTFTLHPAEFLVEMTIEAVAGTQPVRQGLVVSLGSYQDPSEIKEGGMTQIGREW